MPVLGENYEKSNGKGKTSHWTIQLIFLEFKHLNVQYLANYASLEVDRKS